MMYIRIFNREAGAFAVWWTVFEPPHGGVVCELPEELQLAEMVEFVAYVS